MSIRAVVVTNDAGPLHGAMLTALTQGGAMAEILTVRPGGRFPVRAAIRLLAYRPDLVIAEAGSPGSVVAAIYRLLARRSRLLVRTADDAPYAAGSGGWGQQMLLARADAVVSDSESAGPCRAGAARPLFTLRAPRGLEPYLSCPLERGGPAAHRVIYDGPLSPESGVADILLCLAAWAEQHPAQPVEIWWLGEGDLAGVLEAQPLPDTLTQRFLGALDGETTAAAYGQCGIMILPGRMAAAPSPATRAAAAGLVLVGAQRDWAGRLESEFGGDQMGWTFDPASAETMMAAIGDALSSSAVDLAVRRAAGRQWVMEDIGQGPADRLRRALASVMPADQGTAGPAGAAAATARR